jgi:hypothetical protein
LRANDLWSGGLPGGKPEGDSSMPQSAPKEASDLLSHEGVISLRQSE